MLEQLREKKSKVVSMVDLLVKSFVKDYKQTNRQSVRTAYGVLASVVGIICNVLLFAVKLIIGIMIQSISVMADGFNNLSDAASSIISFVGVKIAGRPADKEHPFGHGRVEYVSALLVAFLVIEVGINCFKSSISKIIHPELILFRPVLVVILLISILVKIWLSYFNLKLGKRINSNVMRATAADAKGDVFITLATIISILVGEFTGLAIDGYTGIAVSIFVLFSGYKIAKDTLEPLLGAAIDRDLYEKITKKVESYDIIQGSHDLIVHNYGPTNRMATIHAEVPNDVNFETAHEVIDRIEREVLKEFDMVLVIHMDPIEVNNTLVDDLKDKIVQITKSLEEGTSIHDFRVVNGEHQVNIIFDLVIPHEYDKKTSQNLVLNIHEEVRKLDSRYQCIINLEKSFISD